MPEKVYISNLKQDSDGGSDADDEDDGNAFRNAAAGAAGVGVTPTNNAKRKINPGLNQTGVRPEQQGETSSGAVDAEENRSTASALISSIPSASAGQRGMTEEQWTWLTNFMIASHNTLVENQKALDKKLTDMSVQVGNLQASHFN